MDGEKYLVTTKKNKSEYGKQTTNVVRAIKINNPLFIGRAASGMLATPPFQGWTKKTLTSIPETMMTRLPYRLINIGKAKAKSGQERWPKNTNESRYQQQLDQRQACKI